MATATVEEVQLLKTLRWWDGFVIALCNPGFLLGSLGFTLGIFGVAGSMILWGLSAAIGMLQAWIYSEPATMFGHRSGGIALYAHEGWRKYTTLVGPLASFGYWIGWSVVLSIFGKVIGDLAVSQWWPNSGPVDRLSRQHADAVLVHRDRLHHLRLGVQHLRPADGGVVHLSVRRAADGAARAVRDRPLLHRPLARLQRPRHLRRPVGRDQAGDRLHVHPRLVGVRDRGGRDVRARVQEHP